MLKGVVIGFIAFMGVAHATQAEVTFFCRQKELLGLFEQCEEVKIVGQAGDAIRLYSVTKRQVVSARKNQIFEGRIFNKFEKGKPGQIIGLPSQYLWNSSSSGYMSLCQIEKELKDEILMISCGRYRHETIAKSKAFILQEMEHQSEKGRASRPAKESGSQFASFSSK